MEIKSSKWFAAGPEVEAAITVLSDGAFRLYFHLCLIAARGTGRACGNYIELARALGKSRRSIATHIDELRERGVCRLHPAVNQHRSTEIEICDEFWPYKKANTSGAPEEGQQYWAQIRSWLSERACVRSTFTEAERRLASQLESRIVPLEQIERAIALGCSRKYVSLLNGADTGPILSFCYFKDLIEEAGDQVTHAGYWDYLMPELKHLEALWIAKQKTADANNAPASRSK